MKIEPLHDNVLVKPEKQEEMTKGGIYLPQNVQEKRMIGIVVAAGKGRIKDNGEICPIAVSEGDKVLYGKYSGMEIELDGEKFLMLKEAELFGKILK